MPEYPNWYVSVREMARRWGLHAKNARSVFRKAGVRVGPAEAFSSPVLSLPGTRRVCFDPSGGWVSVGQTGTFAGSADGTLYFWGDGSGGRSFGLLYADGQLAPSVASPMPLTDPGMLNEAAAPIAGASQNTRGSLFRRDGQTTLRHPATSVAAAWGALNANPPSSYTDVIAVDSASIADDSIEFLLREGGEVWRRGYPLPGTSSGSPAPWAAYTSGTLGGSVAEIAASSGRLSWRLSGGGIKTWGSTLAGATNNLIRTIGSVPSGVTKLVSGHSFVAVLTDSGEIWTAGSDVYGEAGLGTSPLPNSGPTNNDYAAFRQALGDGYEDVGAAEDCLLAVKDGQLYSCGAGADDPSGLGNSPLGGRGPDSVHEGTLTAVTDPDPGDVEEVFGNHLCRAACYLTTGGCLYSWGVNASGATGQGLTAGATYSPASVKVARGYPGLTAGP